MGPEGEAGGRGEKKEKWKSGGGGEEGLSLSCY